jgi:hypothetical protein
MAQVVDTPADTQELLNRLCDFCFPEGEDRARRVHGVRTTEIGEMQLSPNARWIPFTAKQTIDATRSCFRWEARFDPGKLTSLTVIDAYEKGRGRISLKAVGLIPIKRIVGNETDRGELQRYLAAITLCPAVLLQHRSLEWKAVGPRTLQVCDKNDPASAVDFEISEEGCPLVCRANRPRLLGNRAVMTPWSAVGSNFRMVEGMRVPGHLEACWHFSQGAAPYYRSDVTSFAALP